MNDFLTFYNNKGIADKPEAQQVIFYKDKTLIGVQNDSGEEMVYGVQKILLPEPAGQLPEDITMTLLDDVPYVFLYKDGVCEVVRITYTNSEYLLVRGGAFVTNTESGYDNYWQYSYARPDGGTSFTLTLNAFYSRSRGVGSFSEWWLNAFGVGRVTSASDGLLKAADFVSFGNTYRNLHKLFNTIEPIGCIKQYLFPTGQAPELIGPFVRCGALTSTNAPGFSQQFRDKMNRLGGKVAVIAGQEYSEGSPTGRNYSAGDEGGAAEITLTAAQSGLPSHNHTASAGYAGNHSHKVINRDGIQVGSTAGEMSDEAEYVTVGRNSGNNNIHTSTDGSHNHGVTVQNVLARDATAAHNNMQPYVVEYFYIKVRDWTQNEVQSIINAN